MKQFKSIQDVEKDWQIAKQIAEEEGIEYSFEDYYFDSLTNVDLDEHDEELLEEWYNNKQSQLKKGGSL